MRVTAELLVAAVGCTPERARLFAPHLDAACAYFDIDTRERLAAFLAQVGHESGSFRWVREIWGPTPAQRRYEGRRDLGNTQPGDGARFKGRGLIQTTGRRNHAVLTDRLRRLLGTEVPDFEAEPERLEEPRWAAWSAADYWNMRGLNALADAGQFDEITKKINGGLNGADDRRARWARARAAITPQADAPPPAAQGEPPMAPFLATMIQAVLPVLVDKIPVISKLPPESQARAVEIVTEAVGARNMQEAVEAIVANPEVARQAEQAVQGAYYELLEAGGGGIAGARQFALQAGEGPQGERVWTILAAVTYSALFFLFMANLIAAAAWGVTLWRGQGLETATQLLTQVLTADIGAALTAFGFWLGSSWGSRAKDGPQAAK